MSTIPAELEELLDGAPDEAVSLLVVSLDLYSKLPPAEPNQQPDEACLNALREGFLAVHKWLMTKISNLNQAQELFMTYGYIGESVTIGDTVVPILKHEWSEQLKQHHEMSTDLPAWADVISTPIDRFRAIARGDMTPLNLDKPGRYRPPKIEVDLDTVNSLARDFDTVKKEFKHQSEELAKLNKHFLDFIHIEHLKEIYEIIKVLKAYGQNFVPLATSETTVLPKELQTFELNKHSSAVTKFFKSLSGTCHHMAELIPKLAENANMMVRFNNEISAAIGGGTLKQSKRGRMVRFDPKALKSIADDQNNVQRDMVGKAMAASSRAGWANGFILTDRVIPQGVTEIGEVLCTPETLTSAFEKIETIHTNNFPHDPSGYPFLPPVCIVPGGGICDWYDDRYIVSAIQLHQYKKSGKLSLTPVEHGVLQLYAWFLAKDAQFTFTGERNTGTFMGDYAGEVKKSATVKFTGADKKMTYVMSQEEADTASRDQTVQDYVGLIFNLFNDMPPSSQLSSRKQALILQYCILESPVRTASFLLKYTIKKEPEITKAALLKLAHTDHSEVRRILTEAVKDPNVQVKVGSDVEKIIFDLFGKDF